MGLAVFVFEKVTRNSLEALELFRTFGVLAMKKILLFLSLGSAILLGGCTDRSLEKGWNVILISIDTLRADHLGSYGYGSDTSPNIDRFAEENIIFRNSYSASAWTFPSHMAMFTARYPTKNSEVIYPKIKEFDRSYRTIAQSLQDAGYETAAFTGGGFVAKSLGFGRGFGVYESYGRNFEDNEKHVFDWITQHDPDQKFFLFIHGFDTHRPYDPPEYLKHRFMKEFPPECEGVTFKNIEPQKFKCIRAEGGIEYMKSQYDAEIFFADSIIGEIFAKLKEHHLYDDSIIIITSDHGDELWDHGRGDHINTLYQELIHVPLIMKVPGLVHQEISVPVSNIQLHPTILNLLGIKDQNDFQATSLVPLFLAPQSEQSIYAVTGRSDRHTKKKGDFFVLGVISNHYKYIERHVKNRGFQQELYNLLEDPHEKKNLADSPMEPVLKKKLDDWEKAVDLGLSLDHMDREKAEVSDETRQQLKSLGYLNPR